MLDMNPEIRKKWVGALRTGKVGDIEVQQGVGRLREENGHYCCLGVLTLLYQVENNIKEDNVKMFSIHDGGDDKGLVLPEEVIEWAGLERYGADPMINKISLSNYNDSVRKTFSEIADLIDQPEVEEIAP